MAAPAAAVLFRLASPVHRSVLNWNQIVENPAYPIVFLGLTFGPPLLVGYWLLTRVRSRDYGWRTVFVCWVLAVALSLFLIELPIILALMRGLGGG